MSFLPWPSNEAAFILDRFCPIILLVIIALRFGPKTGFCALSSFALGIGFAFWIGFLIHMHVPMRFYPTFPIKEVPAPWINIAALGVVYAKLFMFGVLVVLLPFRRFPLNLANITSINKMRSVLGICFSVGLLSPFYAAASKYTLSMTEPDLHMPNRVPVDLMDFMYPEMTFVLVTMCVLVAVSGAVSRPVRRHWLVAVIITLLLSATLLLALLTAGARLDWPPLL